MAETRFIDQTEERAMQDKPTYSPRERGSHSPTKVTSWWIVGSRDRYGEAYFLSESTLITGSGPKRMVHLWENHRPYGVNREVSKTIMNGFPESWADVERMMTPSVMRFDPWSGNA